MRPQLAQRELGLAAIAILAAVIVLAVSVGRSADRKTSSLPQPVQWYKALAAPYTPSSRRTACGQRLASRALGVAHPVLPCGVKIFLEFNGKQVLTQVIDRGHTAPGRTFDVTDALAKLLGLQGSQTIRWRFAS